MKIRILAATLLIPTLFSGCHFLLGDRQGAVRYYSNIPSQCSVTRGLRQKEVARVTSEQQMRDHYGLTFLITFNDGKSPALYGAMYYQSQEENRYCVALPDGRFAVVEDSLIGSRRNMMQEVCFPIKDCFEAPRG